MRITTFPQSYRSPMVLCANLVRYNDRESFVGLPWSQIFLYIAAGLVIRRFLVMQSLSGIKVLDLTRALAGPFCTLILADLGAEVIKVEPTPKGEMAREWGPFDDATSVYYLSCNRNKKSLAVNFRSEEGLALLRQLILKSDVVIQKIGRASCRERVYMSEVV